MWVLLFLLGVPIIVCVSFVLLRRMPVKSTSIAVKLDVGVAWIAALSILLLVPLDIANTFYAYNNHGSYYPPGAGGKNNSVPVGSSAASFDDSIRLGLEPEPARNPTQKALSVCCKPEGAAKPASVTPFWC